MKEVKADLIAKGLKFGIVISRFNEFITNELLSGAHDTLISHGVEDKDIDVFWCPGSFEIPAVVNQVAKSKKYNGIICLGAVIRGETPHFEYVASEVSKGVAKLNMDLNIPVSFGVITSETLEQAIERAGSKDGNKGRQAALSAIEMANLYK
ncbi:MAG TPA: 6,7-dimethyl-8-ribityllumazine synthase, partial [Candidatus Omnitrophica bacterium]|nr:6,7-dimethyl-8-ribityllumazine synthase [Candidatus Omnitrophota bacterium]